MEIVLFYLFISFSYQIFSKIHQSFLFSNESSIPVVPGINEKDGTDAVSNIVYKRDCGQSKAAYP